MKQHIPHALVAALIGCTLAYPALADEQSVDQALQQEIKESDTHSRKLDEIVRKRELEQALAELKKAELEVQRTEKAIEELNEPQPGPTQPGNPLQAVVPPFSNPGVQPNAPGAPAVPTAAVQAVDPLDEVFLTRMYGLDGQQRATIVYKRSLYHVALGEVMADGIKLVKIKRNSVVMALNGKTREVPMSSREAVKAAFEEQKQREAALLVPPVF